MSKHKKHHEEEGGHGGDRPWVYFMVDAFFLITQFFVLTFKVKSDEVVLPQRLPPGGAKPSTTTAVDTTRKLSVHVSSTSGAPRYEFMTKTVDLPGLQEMLANASGGGAQTQVRVSYEPEVPYGHVLAVFNACSKAKINECGLIPSRQGQRRGG
jgi:biopolymer transport protein ExbD